MIKKFAFLILALASNAALAQWVAFDSNEQSASYFIQSKVGVAEGIAYVSVLINFDKPQALSVEAKPKMFYTSKFETLMFDCGTQKFTVPDYSYHADKDGKGEVVHWVSIEPNALQWSDINKNPGKQILFKKIRNACEQN
jgi:hypothetical protein